LGSTWLIGVDLYTLAHALGASAFALWGSRYFLLSNLT
jgi:hypothetical protein